VRVLDDVCFPFNALHVAARSNHWHNVLHDKVMEPRRTNVGTKWMLVTGAGTGQDNLHRKNDQCNVTYRRVEEGNVPPRKSSSEEMHGTEGDDEIMCK
jgi:hypothetical protein